jgi:hypothetical protein
MNAKKQRSDYLKKWPVCQYSQAIPRQENPWAWQGLPRPRASSVPATEVEHIWNRHGAKSEHPSNYASVCRPLHQWKHHFSVEARIAISHFKWKLSLSTGDSSHFDLDALKEMTGKDVVGWVELKLATRYLPAWVERLGLELMEGHL